MIRKDTEMQENTIATKVLGYAINVHKELGAGIIRIRL